MVENYKICCVTGALRKDFPWEHTGDPADFYTFEYFSTITNLIKDFGAFLFM